MNSENASIDKAKALVCRVLTATRVLEERARSDGLNVPDLDISREPAGIKSVKAACHG